MDPSDTEQPPETARLSKPPASAESPRPPGSAEPTPPPGESQGTTPGAGRLAFWRGPLLLLVGSIISLSLMAADRRWGSMGVPLGFGGVLLASIGFLDMFGAFAQRDTPSAASTKLAELTPRVVEMMAAAVVLVALLKLSVSGALMLSPNHPQQQIVFSGLGVTAAFLWLTVCVFRVGRGLGVWQRDEQGEDRGLWRRHGFWLVALTSLLYLPLLGSYSLIDPWETHYGEVAREMLAKDDWISLWWAQDGWFWSKPILDFWAQGLSFAALGVQYQPDQMLAGVAQGRFPQPEWAARMPIFLLSLLGSYVLYRGMAQAVGRRAAMIGGIVLITAPYWYFLTHQTMTDMAYVGPLTAAVGFALLGFVTDPETQVKRYELRFGKRVLSLSGWHLLFGAVTLLVLPQVIYLLSRNVSLLLRGDNLGFQWHLDQFSAGSGGGNCGLPGNQACSASKPVFDKLQPSILALIWTVGLAVILYVNRHERRLARLYFLAAWLMTALSAMGKGAPGLVLPLAVALAYVGVTRRWKLLLRMELPTMLLLVLCVALPWYVQMYLRHGAPFTDRLIFHDMFKRAFVHVHDTNSGDDVSFRYYVWQLGYGLFPWSGLAAAGLVWWTRRSEPEGSRASDALLLMGMWFVTTFGMFSITLTKFHHYILPAVPPIAMLTGVVMDRMLGGRALASGAAASDLEAPSIKAGAAVPYALSMGAVALLTCYASLRLFPGSISGSLAGGAPQAASTLAALAAACAAVACLAVTIAMYGTARQRLTPGGRAATNSALLGAVAIASALVIVLTGVDMVAANPGDIEGQARLVHLFSYNYKRPWPKSLDFTGALSGFSVAAALACALMAWRWLRPHAAALLLGVSVCWAAWGINSYFFYVAPHWGQRETILEYYRQRGSNAEPIVAYQMNWKGENFYTGNRLPAFVSTGQKFKDWIAEQKRAGVHTIYFTTEHSRIAALKRELDNPKRLEVLTNEELNNKFTLARVVFDEAELKAAQNIPTKQPPAAQKPSAAPPSAAASAGSIPSSGSIPSAGSVPRPAPSPGALPAASAAPNPRGADPGPTPRGSGR